MICLRLRPEFRYTCLDIGQGSCNLIEHNGCAYLFDAGSSSVKDVWQYRISSTLKYNSNLLNRVIMMLFDSSDSGLSEELMSHKLDQVPCNDVAREAIGYIYLHYPHLNINFESEVDDAFCIQSNRKYLMLGLRELLYNSAKYSDGKHITMRITLTETTIRFIVEDTGKGIAEADRELTFEFFTKVDDLSEGLGLGLPLSKRHAQNLGGDLTLDEDYHDGCRFIVELPLKL